jgi:hypothetical protein
MNTLRKTLWFQPGFESKLCTASEELYGNWVIILGAVARSKAKMRRFVLGSRKVHPGRGHTMGTTSVAEKSTA